MRCIPAALEEVAEHSVAVLEVHWAATELAKVVMTAGAMVVTRAAAAVRAATVRTVEREEAVRREPTIAEAEREVWREGRREGGREWREERREAVGGGGGAGKFAAGCTACRVRMRTYHFCT